MMPAKFLARLLIIALLNTHTLQRRASTFGAEDHFSQSMQRLSQIEKRLTLDRCLGRFQFDFGSSSRSTPTTAFIPQDRPLPCKPKPRCPGTPAKYYRPDGSCNNLRDGSQGQAGRPFKRLINPNYADGRGTPRKNVNGDSLPSPRKISNVMQSDVRKKSSRHTHMVAIFGQYITHDIANTPTTNRNRVGRAYSGSTNVEINCRCGSRDPACINIDIPRNDIQRTREGKTCLPVIRSQPVANKKCQSRVREQQNLITPYLDAGTVYGSSNFQLQQLLVPRSRKRDIIRTGIGELKTGNLSPHGRSLANAPSLPLVGRDTFLQMACPFSIHKPRGVPCFAAGDNRANENPALLSLHTMFVRLHNKIVKDLNRINPTWSKTKLIHTARLIVAAITQRITYKEYLPEVLGSSIMNRYKISLKTRGYSSGYSSSVDATASNEFAAAALRFGHTLVTSPLTRQTSLWSRQGPHMSLNNSFFDSTPLLTTTFGGANSVLRGLCKDAAKPVDPTFIDDLRNFLFARPGRFGHDLLAINIQRGRDHGITGYNHYRSLCRLRRARRFDDFREIPIDRRRKLQRLYSNQVNDVDLYIGGLSEEPVPGGLLGPTFTCILARQFRDIKNGDRLWHENGGTNRVFDGAQLRAIRRYTFSRLICDTMKDTRTIQPNPFKPNSSANRRRGCSLYPELNLNPWRNSDRVSGRRNSGSNGDDGGGFNRPPPSSTGRSGSRRGGHRMPHPFLSRSFADRHLLKRSSYSQAPNGGLHSPHLSISESFDHRVFKRSMSRLQLCSNVPVEESIERSRIPKSLFFRNVDQNNRFEAIP